MPTYVAQGQGRTREVESNLTARQAAEICITLTSQFARDLASRFMANQSLTRNQIAWLHVLAVEATLRDFKQDTKTSARLSDAPVLKGLVGILQLIKVAQENGLKRIGIRIAMDKQYGLKLTVAGEGARVPGSINVVNDKDGEWYGRILLDGTMDFRSNNPEWVIPLLEEFANDPAYVASRYGHLTSCCSFCGLGLTDDRSVVMGYGPICASKYNLPWGDKKAVSIDFEKLDTDRERNLRYAGLRGSTDL